MAPSTAMVRPGEILQTAVSRGDLARVRDLLRNGASATERGRHDTTALHWAAAANEAAIVAELLENGADPNARAADGCSALHYAAREDAAEAVSALLCGGADARLTNREGRTPLQEVYDENDEEGAAIARLLRDGEKTRDVVFVPSSFGPTSSRHHQSECASRDDDVDTHTSRTSRDGKSDTDSSVGVRGSRSVGASTAVRGDAGIRDSRRTTLGAFVRPTQPPTTRSSARCATWRRCCAAARAGGARPRHSLRKGRGCRAGPERVSSGLATRASTRRRRRKLKRRFQDAHRAEVRARGGARAPGRRGPARDVRAGAAREGRATGGRRVRRAPRRVLASAPARGGRSGKTDAGAAYERVPEAAVAMADARRGGAEAR